MTDYLSGSPLTIGHQVQLLIDDTIVEDRWRLTRVMHQPVRHPRNPIVLNEHPWEADTAQTACVIFDEEMGLFRMWYTCLNMSAFYAANGAREYIAYAQSPDGFNWTKPLFDHCPMGTHKKTNIVYQGTHDQGTYYGNWPPGTPVTRARIATASQVWKDPQDPDPNRRYKMISLEGRPNHAVNEIHIGVQLVTSPDGIHWTLAGDEPILDSSSDCLNHVVRDDARDRWILYCRPPIWHSGRHHGRRNIRRRVAAAVSKDFKCWSYPRTILSPDEWDATDYDFALVFPYGNTFIMLYAAMEGDLGGRAELRMATSSDGLDFRRYHTREAFLPRGLPGAWDGAAIHPSCPPIQRGERLFFYYTGSSVAQEEQGHWVCGIGMATLKLDRFVEQRASATPGYLLTKEFILEGKTLRINTECNKSTNLAQRPQVRVEILRHPPHGSHFGFHEAYDGFALEDCDPICADHTALTVTWKGNGDLSSLVGKPVYLRFELINAGLFSFQLQP